MSTSGTAAGNPIPTRIRRMVDEPSRHVLSETDVVPAGTTLPPVLRRGGRHRATDIAAAAGGRRGACRTPRDLGRAVLRPGVRRRGGAARCGTACRRLTRWRHRVRRPVRPVWWTWTNYAYVADLFDADEGPFRLVLLGAMLFVGGLAATIPDAFDGETAGFVVAYALLRGDLLLVYAWAWSTDLRLRRL